MTTKRSYRGASLFWAYVFGVVSALIITAGAFVFITNAPVPLVDKVHHVSNTTDPALLDGKTIDPNTPLYSAGQGTEQSESTVARVNVGGIANTEVIDTIRWFVQAGAFSQSTDAEAMRARLAFAGTDSQIDYGNERGQRLYRVRVGPFETETAAEEVRQTLSDAGIQSIIIQVNN